MECATAAALMDRHGSTVPLNASTLATDRYQSTGFSNRR